MSSFIGEVEEAFLNFITSLILVTDIFGLLSQENSQNERMGSGWPQRIGLLAPQQCWSELQLICLILCCHPGHEPWHWRDPHSTVFQRGPGAGGTWGRDYSTHCSTLTLTVLPAYWPDCSHHSKAVHLRKDNFIVHFCSIKDKYVTFLYALCFTTINVDVWSIKWVFT